MFRLKMTTNTQHTDSFTGVNLAKARKQNRNQDKIDQWREQSRQTHDPAAGVRQAGDAS